MELLMVILIFALFITIGASSAIFESRAQKKASNWGFHVPEVQQQAPQAIDQAYQMQTTIQMVNTEVIKIQEIDKTPNNKSIDLKNELDTFELENTSNLVTQFEESILPSEVQNSLNQLMVEVNSELEKGNSAASKLSESENESIINLIGPRVASLVTSLLSNLTENEEVISIGTYENNAFSYDGVTLNVSSDIDIYCGADDFIVVKGTLLPNGNFRILQWEDADTVECGFSGEEFLLNYQTA